jgi:dipeptide/tripeptide permease
MCPDINNLIISFVIGNETHVIVVQYLINLVVTICHKFFFLGRNNHIIQVKRQTTSKGHVISEIFYIIQKLCCFCNTCNFKNASNNISKRFLGKQLIYVAYFFRHSLVENNPAYSGFNYFCYLLTTLNIFRTYLNYSMQITRFSLYAICTSSGE